MFAARFARKAAAQHTDTESICDWGNMPEKVFAKEFQIPAEFPEILRGLTREVLRAQPADINKFAFEYFRKMKEEQSLTQSLTSDDNY